MFSSTSLRQGYGWQASTKTLRHRDTLTDLLHEALRSVTSDVGYIGLKVAILARRKELQVRILGAERMDYCKTVGTAENAGAGGPVLYLDSSPDLSRNR